MAIFVAIIFGQVEAGLANASRDILHHSWCWPAAGPWRYVARQDEPAQGLSGMWCWRGL